MYPDNPSYQPSPYSPSQRHRSSRTFKDVKYKRQSKLREDFFDEVYGRSRSRPERRLPSSSETKPNQDIDLQQSPSQNTVFSTLFRDNVVNRKRKKVLKLRKVTIPKLKPAQKPFLTNQKTVFRKTSSRPITSQKSSVSIQESTVVVSPTTMTEEVTTTASTTEPTVFLPTFIGPSLPEKLIFNEQENLKTLQDIKTEEEDVVKKELTTADDVLPNVFLIQSSTEADDVNDDVNDDVETLKEIEIIGNTVSDNDEDEYFEDYYNFPLGSRITSVINNLDSRNNEDDEDLDQVERSDDDYEPVHKDAVVKLVIAEDNKIVPEHYTL